MRKKISNVVFGNRHCEFERVTRTGALEKVNIAETICHITQCLKFAQILNKNLIGCMQNSSHNCPIYIINIVSNCFINSLHAHGDYINRNKIMLK